MDNLRDFFRRIEPAVEKPTAKTTIGRTLALAGLLIAITAITAVCVARWLITAGRIIGAAYVAPVVILAALVYGVRITRNPLGFRFSERAKPYKRLVIGALAIGALCGALYLSGNWPRAWLPGGELLWYTWQTIPVALGGGVWGGLRYQPMREIISETTLVWGRVILLIVLPLALPAVVRLLWYRYSVEIVYPSWPDSAVTRGLRWLDPLGLLNISYAPGDPQPGDPQPGSNKPREAGDL